MKPGREIDAKIAQEVFGHKVWAHGKVLMENPATGDRPLRKYSRDMEWAWEVAKQMNITLIPIEGGQWFAFAGPTDVKGWKSPKDLFEYFTTGNFVDCGASLSTEAPLAICEAALNVVAKRGQPSAESPLHLVTDDEPATQLDEDEAETSLH